MCVLSLHLHLSLAHCLLNSIECASKKYNVNYLFSTGGTLLHWGGTSIKPVCSSLRAQISLYWLTVFSRIHPYVRQIIDQPPAVLRASVVAAKKVHCVRQTQSGIERQVVGNKRAYVHHDPSKLIVNTAHSSIRRHNQTHFRVTNWVSKTCRQTLSVLKITGTSKSQRAEIV